MLGERAGRRSHFAAAAASASAAAAGVAAGAGAAPAVATGAVVALASAAVAPGIVAGPASAVEAAVASAAILPLLRLPRLLRLLLRLLSLRLIACATDRIMVVVGRRAAVLRSFFHMFLRQYRCYSHTNRDITNSCLNMLPIVVTLSWRTRVNEPYIIQLVNGFVPDNKAGALPMRQGAPQRLSTKDYRPNCMR